MDAIGSEGIVTMTQGAPGHSGAQGRARGFWKIVKKHPKVEVVDTTPADWDVTKVARIWEVLLTKFPKIDAAYFHNDDMALAAYEVMKAHNRTGIKGGATIAGVAAVVSGEKTGMGPGTIPKQVVTDGPVVTKANAPGLLWMEEHFLI